MLSTFSSRLGGVPRVNGAVSQILRCALVAAVGTAAVAATPDDAESSTLRVVAVGDSLIAGLGLDPEQGFVAQLQKWLSDLGADVEILNAGVSGDTTMGGLVRLDWSVGDDADGVILSLGANDMLRGIDPAATRAHLEGMLARLSERGLPTLLVGMRAGANLGPEYRAAFDSAYPDLAEQFHVPLYPFLLEGVALEPGLNQADGIHPNAAGVARIVEGIGPFVLVLARSIRSGK